MKECNIDPRLRFHFEKNNARGEVTVRVVVRFELGKKARSKSKKVEECRFGWFQDNLNIALTSMMEGVDALDVDYQVIDEPKIFLRQH